MDNKFDPNSFLRLDEEVLNDKKKNGKKIELSINNVPDDEDTEDEYITEIPKSQYPDGGFGTSKMPVTIDQAFELSGGFGRYQKMHATIVILTMISSMFFLFSLVFLEAEPKYLCKNDDGTESICESEVFCTNSSVEWRVQWEDNESIDNFILQFSLQCDAEVKIGLFGSCFLAGIVLGSIFLTRLGDIYGRKPIFIIGMILQVSVTASLLFITNYILAYFVVFLIGFSVTGKQFVGFAYLLEMQPTNKQALIGTLEFICEGCIYLLVTIYFAWIDKRWYFVQVPTLFLGTVGSISLFFLPESPRFLISTQQYDKARAVFTMIAKFNKKSSFIIHDFVFPDEQQAEKIIEKNEDMKDHPIEQDTKSGGHGIDKKGLKQMCTNPRLRANLIFSGFIWAAYIFNYYIVAFYLKYFPGDIYQNAFAMGFSDVAAYVVAGVVIKKVRMSWSLILSLSISLLGAILYLFLYSYTSLIPIFIVLCRVGNGMIVNILYVSNNKLFPVELQSSSFGILNFISHFAAVGSPLVAEMADPYPFLIFIANASISIVACIFLKELTVQIKPQ